MILHWDTIDNKIPKSYVNSIKNDLTTAFVFENSKEIAINNSKFFKLHADGKLKAIVMNQADFLSKGFQSNLEKGGWVLEKNIKKQTIDGYINYCHDKVETATISKEELINSIGKFDPDKKDYLNNIFKIYNCYYTRKCFVGDPVLSDNFNNEVQEKCNLRIGLEFETGNIASSFRATSKLNYLFETGDIDVGVFITSNTKFVSTNIWPSSNRNGSIEELNNRNFKNQIFFPLFLVGFEPEVWDKAVGFLKKDGTRYSLPENYETVEINNKQYRHYTDNDIYMLIE